MNVLITGGAGFIGSNLALKLLSKGYNITVLDNLSEQIHGVDGKSPLYLSIKDKVKFIQGDVRNREDWMKALKDQDVVVHFAAETGTGQSMYQIEKYIDVNIRGTALLLDILANEEHSIRKIIVASSRAIYGEGAYECGTHGTVHPTEREDHHMAEGDFEVKCPVCSSNLKVLPTGENSKIHPSSVYGITKQCQEKMILTVGKALNIPSIAFRYQNVYGPGQSLLNPYTGILSVFSTRIKTGNKICIFEDGKESRDFVYIDDVVNATILGIEDEKASYEVFNVGSGIRTDVLTVAEILAEKYKADIEIEINGKYRRGDIRHNYADLSKIGKVLGFEPKYNFDNGISKFVDWVNAQEIQNDGYQRSISEMEKRGLYK